ncbi:ATP-binding cassette domain-containing protein [Acidaminococcus sp. NSJ-142]|jgi:ABC-2 type transport system ATP-binding protein|uniref:ATP-binding cassette domain-containing protein n=1 Tax=Acidaminococcus TaxID=904 RepID=UPI000CFA258E|nr:MULTISPECIES: ATP-binding cassette domain-containing protein [Acidaminococcus]MCD2436188.1 ATP-binding cassette domain-containing protein [Acidaminococcus hominis]MCH4097035.1 ATP-binding cassette domain-containing protein [Acidaminococcus provencensis]RHK01706.1 ABC transporter ATP-binding protein [Acidaminococcus sp. AM05-11]
MADWVVRAQGLEKLFDDKQGRTLALNQVDFQAAAGKMTALIGPDGAGKTTTLRLLCGLLSPTGGKLEVLGLDAVQQAPEIQTRINYMPQKFGLYEDLTVQENLDLYADLFGVEGEKRRQRFAKLLSMTGLEAFTGRLAGNLSGGMKQKLGLACTLVRSPELLLLDEPTVGVDPLSRQELWVIIKQLVQEEHLSVIVCTAYMNEAAMCDDVYVLNQGKILFQGTPESLQNVAQGRCFEVVPPQGLPCRVIQGALLDDPDVVDAVPQSGLVRYIALRPEKLPATLGKWQLAAQPAAPRLEDGFMILLHRDAKPEDKQLELTPLEPGTYQPVSPEVSIKVENLVKKFGDFTAVSHTSFQVHRGEVFGLLGPNGAGKTTTFRMLCGLLPATEGVLSVAGENLRTARTQARAKIGYVAQKFSLYSKLSVLDNLQFFGGIYGIPPKKLKERIKLILEEFRLEGMQDKNAGDLPGGYKQRLSMACALLQEPEILFLDEPTSGIDPLARRLFWRQITDLAMKGTTIIVTTHFMEEAEYCDRIMIQDRGEMLIVGSAEEIRQQLHKPRGNMDELFIDIVHRARAAKGEENHAGHHQ